MQDRPVWMGAWTDRAGTSTEHSELEIDTEQTGAWSVDRVV